MHSQNIIHRDIRSENLLINKNDQAKICDLGFARTMPSNGQMSDYVGTDGTGLLRYLLEKKIMTSIDIWSIGCVMAVENLFWEEKVIWTSYI